MTARTSTTVVLVLLLTCLARSPLSMTVNAQMSASCNRAIAQNDAALRQNRADAQREGVTYARNEIRDAGLDVLKSKLAGDPTAEALEQSREAFQKWRDFIDQGKSHLEMMADLARCVSVSGATGCLNEIIAKNTESNRLLGRVSDATNEWIKSLANDSISKAAERVEKARSIMQNLVSRAGNLATGAASDAMESCLRDMERRVEARTNAEVRSSPPQARTLQPPASQPPVVQPAAPENAGGNSVAEGGSNAGKIIGYSAAGVGAAVGGVMLADYAEKMKCTQYETEMDSRVNSVVNASNALTRCGASVSCQNTQLNAITSSVSSMLTTAGNWCTCLGPSAAAELTAADKAVVRGLFNDLRAAGINSGTLPACFR